MTGLTLVFARKSDFPAFVARVREVYARTRSASKAAKELGIGTRTLFRWLEAHPELKEAQEGRELDSMGRPVREDKKSYSPPKITVLSATDSRVQNFHKEQS